jgi:hypothetical protein
MSRQTVSRNHEQSKIARIFRWLGTLADPGPGLALNVRWTVTLALMGALGSGCLVTERHTFQDEPDSPPQILDAPGQPRRGSINRIDNMSEMPEWVLGIRVRDENVGQVLWAHWRVVKNPSSSGGTTNPAELPDFNPLEVPKSTDAIRDFEIRVPTNLLAQHLCHRLELAVSGSFIQHGPDCPMLGDCEALYLPQLFAYRTGDQDDLDEAWWWLLEGDGSATDAEKADLLDSCHAQDLSAQTEPMQP